MPHTQNSQARAHGHRLRVPSKLVIDTQKWPILPEDISILKACPYKKFVKLSKEEQLEKEVEVISKLHRIRTKPYSGSIAAKLYEKDGRRTYLGKLVRKCWKMGNFGPCRDHLNWDERKLYDVDISEDEERKERQSDTKKERKEAKSSSKSAGYERGLSSNGEGAHTQGAREGSGKSKSSGKHDDGVKPKQRSGAKLKSVVEPKHDQTEAGYEPDNDPEDHSTDADSHKSPRKSDASIQEFARFESVSIKHRAEPIKRPRNGDGSPSVDNVHAGRSESAAKPRISPKFSQGKEFVFGPFKGDDCAKWDDAQKKYDWKKWSISGSSPLDDQFKSRSTLNECPPKLKTEAEHKFTFSNNDIKAGSRTKPNTFDVMTAWREERLSPLPVIRRAQLTSPRSNDNTISDSRALVLASTEVTISRRDKQADLDERNDKALVGPLKTALVKVELPSTELNDDYYDEEIYLGEDLDRLALVVRNIENKLIISKPNTSDPPPPPLVPPERRIEPQREDDSDTESESEYTDLVIRLNNIAILFESLGTQDTETTQEEVQEQLEALIEETSNLLGENFDDRGPVRKSLTWIEAPQDAKTGPGRQGHSKKGRRKCWLKEMGKRIMRFGDRLVSTVSRRSREKMGEF